MAERKIKYATSTGITCTLASLANSSARESTVVDNGTNLYLDALVTVAVTLGATAPSGDKQVVVYLYASEDGTNYTDNATGSDAAITLRSPTNLVKAMVLHTPTASLAYKGVFSVAQFFGGVLPRKWGIVVRNNSGSAFSATEGDHVKSYSGVTETVA